MILSFYENNLPIRFGVLLYSSKFIKQTESGDDELTKSEADTSCLVTYFYFYFIFDSTQHAIYHLLSMIYNINNISRFLLIINHNVQLLTI